MVKDPLLIGYSFEVPDWGGNQPKQCPVSNSAPIGVNTGISNESIIRVGPTCLVTEPPSVRVTEFVIDIYGQPSSQNFCITKSEEVICNDTENLFGIGETHFVSNPPSSMIREAIDNIYGQPNAQSSLITASETAINNDNENYIGVGGTQSLSQPNVLPSQVPDDVAAEPVGKPFVGMEFDTIEASQAFWEKYARDTGFRARIRSSRKKKDGVIRTRSYVCAKEGTRAEDPRRTTDKRRPVSRCGCGVIMTVNFVKVKGFYRVSTFFEEHNHGLDGVEGHLNITSNELSMCKPIVGMEFATLEASQVFWEQYARDVGFGARIGVTRKGKKDGIVRLRTYVCSREGNEYYDPRYINSKRRGDRRCGCGVLMTVKLVKEKGTFRVETFTEEHNHGLDGKPSAPRPKKPRQQRRVGPIVGEDPFPKLTNGQDFEIDNELDCNTNVSQLAMHEKGHLRKNLLNAQRMGILFSEFMQLAYRAVGDEEVFKGVRRLIREGHSLADKH